MIKLASANVIFFSIKIYLFALFVIILNLGTMKNAVLQRVKELSDIMGYKSETKFAEAIGIKQRTLNQQLTGLRALSLDTVLAILSSFDGLSAEWLLRGRGEVMEEDNMKNAMGDMLTKLEDLHSKYYILQQMYDEKCAEVASLKKAQDR